jgi:ABC-2 type transport system permease protein
MNSNKVMLVLKKEWLDLRQQKGLWIGMFVPAVIFAVLPLFLLYFVANSPGDAVKGLDDGSTAGYVKINPLFTGMGQNELGQSIVGQQFSLLMLLLPAILPGVVASYSVVGEKTERTLEPVLATPIRTWELLVGKCLTALIPTVGLTWVLGLIMIIGTNILAISPRVAAAIVSPGWLISLILASPLLGLLSVAATVAVSSRVNDPRTAQQISAFMIIPVMGVFFGQITGLFILSPVVALLGVLVLAVLSVVAVYLMVSLFKRETILTRWS